MKAKYFILLLIFILITFFSYKVYVEFYGKKSNSDVNIIVKKGDTAKIISKMLFNKDVIKIPFLFEKYLIFTKRDRLIKPGKHQFSRGESYRRISKNLITEYPEYLTVTIPEGFTKKEIISRLSKIFDNKKVEEEFSKIEKKGLDFNGRLVHNLEGLLFPDTYKFTKNNNIKDIIMMMNSRFIEIYKECMKMAKCKINPYDSIILASIIEKEAKENDEKRKIAGVFFNRLQRGMPLASCATVEYALIQKTGERKPRLYNKDIKIDSEYNTYINKGLPPAPICCPGKISIEAALNPEIHDFLYFISIGKRHHFSKTLREHLHWKKKLKNNIRNK